ncbi:MAG: cohesin domain-containing protein, partial [Ilumatobacteraceae bacterium]
MHKTALMAATTILIAPLLTLGSTFSEAGAAGPQLSITAVQQTDVGQTIEINLRLSNAPLVAGYEASVRYDEDATEFAGVVFGDGSGRGNVVTTITTGPGGGAAYSAYTCLASGCPAGGGAAGRSALDGVTVRIQPLLAGHHVVSFDQLKFVDLQGRSVDVDVPVSSVAIDVGNAGPAAPIFTSPPVQVVLPADSGAASAAPLNATAGDASVLAAYWTDARRFDACTVDGANDPNGDGCLDIADLQLLGGSPAGARAAAAPSVSRSGAVDSSLQAATIPWVVARAFARSNAST